MIAVGPTRTEFLNVDLDLRCQVGLDELLGHLEPLALVQNRTAHEACIELEGPYSSLDDCLCQLIALVQSLPERPRTIWDSCDLRSFNIGIQGGMEPHSTSFVVSGTTLALIGNLHAEIAITVYAPQPAV